MSKQLLIYENVVPVSSERHRDWSVKVGLDYAFTKDVNSVPLMAIEFPVAAMEYSIVFAGTDNVMPLVILGVRTEENLYLKDDGGWDSKYIPAFVRRYPFVFSSIDDGSSFRLCIDESFSGCNQDGVGERLFDAGGERTQYLESVLGFLKQEQVAYQRTRAFCNKLKELNLLEPTQAQITSASGQKTGLRGFQAVNRDRLKGLSGDQLKDLAKTDELELIYLHLHSLKNFAPTMNRGQARSSEESAGDGDASGGDSN